MDVSPAVTTPATKTFKLLTLPNFFFLSFRVLIVQELCESRGGRPEPSFLTSLLVSVDVKNY